MPSLTTHRTLVLAAVMAANFMIAIEATIVSTAMPQIVGQLGGLPLYSWVFSAFLLTQTATTVVFGKLADLIGRKTVMLVGIVIFLFGSILCGFAWSMPSLIVFRLVQGIGAGAVQPTAMTIVGDLYAVHERAKIQGWLASVWALAAVLGPLAGGLIIQRLSWAWIFWINLPIGALATAGFCAYLHEKRARGRGKIDHLSAGFFTVAIAAIMADLTALSTSGELEIGLTTLVAVVAVVLFVLQERRSPEPMISLDLWGRRPIAAANVASLLAGMVMIGLTTFLPVFVQGVMQKSPLIGGFALSAMVLGWPIGSTIGIRAGFKRFGVRAVLRAGGVLMPLGALAFIILNQESSPLFAGLGSFVVGLGMGASSASSIILIQEIVGWSERGSVTASYLFARSLGSTFGATVFGAVLNFGLLRSGHTGVSSDQLRQLLERGSEAGGDPGLRAALEQSLHLTFVSMFAIALMTAATLFLVPKVVFAPRQPALAE
jgi:MFS family permease